MDEYISREETAKAFCEKCKGYYDGHCIHRVECDIDVIKTAPAADVQPVKQWVKLHDKHPDTEGSYLVCDQYGECEVAKYIPCIKSWFTHKVNGEIRYWMPLPEPPKDGDAE